MILTAVCPECLSGKHLNCAHAALNQNDEIVECACERHAHQAVTMTMVPMDGDNRTLECSMCGVIGVFPGNDCPWRVHDHLTAHGCDVEQAIVQPLEEQ